jgi:lipopolysaccharide export system permease protein
MTTFDLHIMRRFLMGTLLLIAALIVFFIVLHYVEYIDDFMDRGATMREVFLGYYPNYVPEIVRLISPLAIFLSCVYLTSKLSQQLQLAALQTSGVSLYRLLRPYLIVALLFTGFMFWFNGWIVPQTNRFVLEFERKYMRDAMDQTDVNDLHRQNTPRSVITVRYYDANVQTAHGVSLLQYADESRLAARLDTERMQWVDSLGRWNMQQVTLRSFSTEGLVTQRDVAELDTVLNLLPRDFARTERDVEGMTIEDAAAHVAQLKRSGVGNLGRTLVAYYSKFSYPFANLIVVLIGVPLAAVRRRGGQAVQIGLGLLTAFVYLALMKLTEPLGYAGTLSPVVTAWLPHALFFAAAVIYLVRVRK